MNKLWCQFVNWLKRTWAWLEEEWYFLWHKT